MLDRISEVLVSRFPFIAILLAVVVALTLTACDDGSDNESKPRRSTSTSSSTTTSTTTTASTVPPPPTVAPADAIGTCGNQTEAIVAAIGGSDMNELTRQGQYTVQACRLATSSPIWAAADVLPKPGVMLDQATAVLQRIGALWNVMEIGTSGVGCTDTPANIRTELALVC